ncbi:MAG: hypothetical protein AVDCRST_MAG55-846, partial [uncultured Rubrobacteraceae bacterium]
GRGPFPVGPLVLGGARSRDVPDPGRQRGGGSVRSRPPGGRGTARVQALDRVLGQGLCHRSRGCGPAPRLRGVGPPPYRGGV